MSSNGERTVEAVEASESTALTRVVSDDGFRLALEPSSYEQAIKLAQVAARIGLCGVQSPEDALVRIMTGRALGIPTFAALKGVYVIDGRPALEAKLKVALALRARDVEYLELAESSPTRATWRAKRRGRPEVSLSFTIEEARTAGLLDRGKDPSKNNWNRFPAAMLRARASSHLVDIVAPDACAGLPTTDEAYEIADAARDERELTGDVVQPANAVATPATESVMIEMQDRILAAKTPEERKAVRTEVVAFVDAHKDDGFGDRVRRFIQIAWGKPKSEESPAPDGAES